MNTIADYLDLQPFAISDYLVKHVPKKTARDFIKEYHYARGSGNAVMSWGLYEQVNNQLVCVIAFQTPNSENVRASIFEDINGPASESIDLCDCQHIDREHGYREHVTELHRMALHPDCPQNTGTWFISRALDKLKAHKPKYWAVVSMADSTEGHEGTVYQAASADYYGMSDPATFYRDEDGRLRHPRQGGENITIAEAKARGWEVVRRKAKHRYVFWLPDPYGSKDELRELAEIELHPYP